MSDRGVGMTAKEIDKFINQIAFSGAEEFMKKYKKDANAIIGHFGLGFYSAFMVSDQVEIITKSYKRSKAVKWTCKGDPKYTIEDVDNAERGTTVILHLDKDSTEFLEESRIQELLNKYSRFLPIPIVFGKEQEWKDNEYVDTDKDKVINITEPAWTKKPADLKEEDYKTFYNELYPMSEEPLFNIHLNVDYPFTLTGILYFPKIRSNFEVQKNKIRLFSNQVFVTDSVEGIVPDFLTLLHGVLDSPDIPLNVSRSFLQSDQNVKKISGHITKKVADRLKDIFKNEREQFEAKWDDLKLFINYGMLTEEKFWDKAKDFALFKNTDGKYFTYSDYKDVIKANQTDKDGNLIYLYANNKDEEYGFIKSANDKGYDVLIMDGQFDTHFINHLEQKFDKSKFVRVDSDVADKLIPKDEKRESKLSHDQQDILRPVFQGQVPAGSYFIQFEALSEDDKPMVVTQSEFTRRMKDMSKMSGGGGMDYYGSMPDTFNMVVNTNHPIISSIFSDVENKLGVKINEFGEAQKPLLADKDSLEKLKEGKKDEEVSQEEKDKMEELNKKIDELKKEKEGALEVYGKDNQLVKQIIDLALLANNMLTGEALNAFVNRSIDLIKK